MKKLRKRSDEMQIFVCTNDNKQMRKHIKFERQRTQKGKKILKERFALCDFCLRKQTAIPTTSERNRMSCRHRMREKKTVYQSQQHQQIIPEAKNYKGDRPKEKKKSKNGKRAKFLL